MMQKPNSLPGFSIDKIANAAGNDPDILRMENLDTDLLPPESAVESTRKAIGQDAYNSYLPFTGLAELRADVAQKLSRETNKMYAPDQVVITAGATEGMLDVLLAMIRTGDEVILTDPTYAGMIQRVVLAGGTVRFVPFVELFGEWRLDLETLKSTINSKTKAIFLMNPSMPSGALLSLSDWELIARLCREFGIWLIYNAAMERILYDNRKVIHPAALNEMEHKTIIIGSVSKEYRMISWRVGWIVAPKSVIEEIGKVHIYNVVTVSGFAQAGAIAALNSSEEDFLFHKQIWELRRNVMNSELSAYQMLPAAGGWSQIMDVSPMKLSAEEASKLLLAKGKIAVTPMTHWGDKNSRQFIRLVFSNEPVERLRTLGERFRATFGRII